MEFFNSIGRLETLEPTSGTYELGFGALKTHCLRDLFPRPSGEKFWEKIGPFIESSYQHL